MATEWLISDLISNNPKSSNFEKKIRPCFEAIKIDPKNEISKFETYEIFEKFKNFGKTVEIQNAITFFPQLSSCQVKYLWKA